MKAPVGSGGFRPTSAFISGLFWPWNDPLLLLLWTQRCTLVYFFSITGKNVFLFEICVQRFMFSLVFSRWFYMGINHNLLMPLDARYMFFQFSFLGHPFCLPFKIHGTFLGHSKFWTHKCNDLQMYTQVDPVMLIFEGFILVLVMVLLSPHSFAFSLSSCGFACGFGLL